MKTCKRCQRELPLGSFYAHKRMADGHLSFCKDCTRNRVGKHREQNVERIRAYDRARGFRVYDPVKVAARQAVHNAVRRCELTKGKCWCGQIGEAHHADYSMPLDVEWLCKKHHMEAHRKSG